MNDASSEGRYFSDFYLNKQCNEQDYRDKPGKFSNLAKIHGWRLEYMFILLFFFYFIFFIFIYFILFFFLFLLFFFIFFLYFRLTRYVF